MKHFLTILFLSLILTSFSAYAQLEGVIVETYYISDANDATDTTGGLLDSGSTTYRIYIDLVEGAKLQKIYGDANHALKISSTSPFFNHAQGQSFAKDIPRNDLGLSTIALDSWLTIGQITKNSAKTYTGVLKAEDTDAASFIGGANNDGGSAIIATGLLTNTLAAAGIPLTAADGYNLMTPLPNSWENKGIVDSASGVDSSIFGYEKKLTQFSSNNAYLKNSGVALSIAGNKILVAQLTTKGTVTFELNIEVVDTSGNIIKYVANDSILLSGETRSGYLSYPSNVVCGCPDVKYFEYNERRDCDNQDSCKNVKKFGCTDPMACNYDPSANMSLKDVCCYPGNCQDRDISVVCPQLSIAEEVLESGFTLFPNPASNQLELQLNASITKLSATTYVIYDFLGSVLVKQLVNATGNNTIDVSLLANGVYSCRILNESNGVSAAKIFVKN